MLYIGTIFEYLFSESKKQRAFGFSNNDICYSKIIFLYIYWSKIMYFWPKYDKNMKITSYIAIFQVIYVVHRNNFWIFSYQKVKNNEQ